MSNSNDQIVVKLSRSSWEQVLFELNALDEDTHYVLSDIIQAIETALR